MKVAVSLSYRMDAISMQQFDIVLDTGRLMGDRFPAMNLKRSPSHPDPDPSHDVRKLVGRSAMRSGRSRRSSDGHLGLGHDSWVLISRATRLGAGGRGKET